MSDTHPAGTAALVALKDLYETEGAAALARLLEDRLDAIAGKWALTEWERHVHEACRAQFGTYQPDRQSQARFVAQMNAERAASLDVGRYQMAEAA